MQFSMFSTYSNVEKPIENVENCRKSGVFAWKTVGICVEKNVYVEKSIWIIAENVVISAFQAFWTICVLLEAGHGKIVEKKFFNMENYVGNVTKPRKTVVFWTF